MNLIIIFFDLLLELDCSIHSIEIKDSITGIYNIDIYTSTKEDFINIKQIFKERVKLININNTNYIHFYENFLDNYIRVRINIEDSKLIILPSKTNYIKISHLYESNESFPTNNLPKKLNKLYIESYIPYDISNLPNQLISLKITGCKYNLDSLPPNLKFLEISKYDEMCDDLLYDLDSFANLPPSLKKIKLDNYYYSSLTDLLNNYEKIEI